MITLARFVAELDDHEIAFLELVGADDLVGPEDLESTDLEMLPRLLHFGLLATRVVDQPDDTYYLGLELTDAGCEAIRAFVARRSAS